MEKQTAQENKTAENIPEESRKTSQDDSTSENSNLGEVIESFNEILGKQLERLMDTRYGIDELPLDIFSVSSLVLLATRETEIDTFPHLPPPRYTQTSLFEELLEINIDPGDKLSSCVESMGNKGYIEISDDGRIFSKKSTLSMAQLLDHIFPKMPGLNLVAYLGQMIDEVLAERKEIDEASQQLNQLLDMQGVSINAAVTTPLKTPKKRHPYLRLGDTTAEKITKKARIIASKPTDIFSQLEVKSLVSTPPPKKEAETVESGDIIEEQKAAQASVEADSVVTEETDKIPVAQDVDKETETSMDTDSHPMAEEIEEPESITPEITPDDEFEPPDDMDIEAKIAEFEEKLGLTCPMCGVGEIRANETARGKSYYQCSNLECGFISWGKPFYIECPKCENNFLIEVADNSGKTMLRCPRSTCTHWQKFPWDEPSEESMSEADLSTPIKKAKRRVKRRRVVRRKKRR